MKTEKPNGYCQECGDEISSNLKSFLRICPDCSKLNNKRKEPLKLFLSNRTAKGWC